MVCGASAFGAANILQSTPIAVPNPLRQGFVAETSANIVNQSSSTPAGNVKVVVALPAGLPAFFSESSAGTHSLSGNTVTFEFGTLPPSGFCWWRIEFRGKEQGQHTIISTASSSKNTDIRTRSVNVIAPPNQFYNPNTHIEHNDPIGTFSGNYVVLEPPDLAVSGPLSLVLQRYYDSSLLNDGNTNLLTYTNTLLTSVTDGLGRTLTFAYNPNGFLTSVTDGARSVNYGHTGSNLTSFVDALSQVTTYSYDPANTNSPALMTARALPEGNAPFTQVYDAASAAVIAQSDAASNTTTLSYFPGVGLAITAITNPVGQVQFHGYNQNGELLGIFDEAGQFLQSGVDTAGRRNFIRDRQTNDTRIVYNLTNGFPTQIDHAGIGDDFFFYTLRNVQGIDLFDLVQITRPDGRIDRFGYDAFGNLTAFSNRIANVWRYAYNERGQLLNSTNPLGCITTFTYDSSGRLLTGTVAVMMPGRPRTGRPNGDTGRPMAAWSPPVVRTTGTLWHCAAITPVVRTSLWVTVRSNS